MSEKWWLISDKDVKTLWKALQEGVKLIEGGGHWNYEGFNNAFDILNNCLEETNATSKDSEQEEDE